MHNAVISQVQDESRQQDSRHKDKDAAFSKLIAEKQTLESKLQEMEKERNSASKEAQSKQVALDQLQQELEVKGQECDQLSKDLEKVSDAISSNESWRKMRITLFIDIFCWNYTEK